VQRATGRRDKVSAIVDRIEHVTTAFASIIPSLSSAVLEAVENALSAVAHIIEVPHTWRQLLRIDVLFSYGWIRLCHQKYTTSGWQSTVVEGVSDLDALQAADNTLSTLLIDALTQSLQTQVFEELKRQEHVLNDTLNMLASTSTPALTQAQHAAEIQALAHLLQTTPAVVGDLIDRRRALLTTAPQLPIRIRAVSSRLLMSSATQAQAVSELEGEPLQHTTEVRPQMLQATEAPRAAHRDVPGQAVEHDSSKISESFPSPLTRSRVASGPEFEVEVPRAADARKISHLLDANREWATCMKRKDPDFFRRLAHQQKPKCQ
jgi:hypothetical protein